MSITSLDRAGRISPMFFDGPFENKLENNNLDGVIYNERCVDPDIEHVNSGAYRERCVDPELEEGYYQVGNKNRFSRRNSKRRISGQRSRKSSRKEPYRASTSSSDLERALDDNGLHISGSETDDSETSSSPGGIYCAQNRGTSPIAESPVSDGLTITGDSKSYQSFGSYSSTRTPRPGQYLTGSIGQRPSLGSSVYSSARSKASEASSTSSTGSFSRLRQRNGSRTSKSSREKRMGHVWSEPDTTEDVWASSTQKTEFDVDWSVFEREAQQLNENDLSAEDFLPPPPPPPLPIFTNPIVGDQGDPSSKSKEENSDSVFGSLPSTPTDVTSLWDDLPGDASEAFKDFDLEPQTQRTITPVRLEVTEGSLLNPHSDKVLEESRLTIKKVVVSPDGVRETFTHTMEWSNQLILFDEPKTSSVSPPPPLPPDSIRESKSVASVESYSSDEEVFERKADSPVPEKVLIPRESTTRLLTESTEEPSSPVSNLQQFFSPFLNPAIGPLSSTDTLNEESESDSDSTLTRSPSITSSSTATSAHDDNPFYDDCPYDTGTSSSSALYTKRRPYEFCLNPLSSSHYRFGDSSCF